MSCSLVKINGAGSGTIVAGPPLFIANLDPIRDKCFTNQQTSILYPRKYIGDTAVEVAPVALGLHEFPGPDPDFCGSDNLSILELLKGSLTKDATKSAGGTATSGKAS